MTRNEKKPPRPTITEVAELAGVSVGSVSRVLNGNATVSADVRIRVEQAIKKLHFIPAQAAQNLRRGATKMVGLLLRDITVGMLAEFAQAAEAKLQASGYAVIMACTEDDSQRTRRLVDALVGRGVEGLIMTTALAEDVLKDIQRRHGVPMVLIDRDISPDLDAVLAAHREGMRRAVEYLLGLGHRRIALVTGARELYPARERIAGYEAGFASFALTPEPGLVIATSFAPESAFTATSMLLSHAGPPTAVIAGGIGLLPGVLRAARAHSLSVPRQLSVVGSGDGDLAQLFDPPMTVVSWRFADIGSTAAQLLLERIEAPATPVRHILLPTELLIRDSCRPPPA
jgi:LacI family transcriptional regulator